MTVTWASSVLTRTLKTAFPMPEAGTRVTAHVPPSSYPSPSLLAGSRSPEDANMLYENKLLGVPRLRMLRIRNDSCEVHDKFRSSISVRMELERLGAGSPRSATATTPSWWRTRATLARGGGGGPGPGRLHRPGQVYRSRRLEVPDGQGDWRQ